MNKPRLKGLGRGLDALLAANQEDEAEKGELQMLPTIALQPGKYQPRTRMDPGSLEELAASIKAQGIMQPIMVRPVGDDAYEIIAGERRWRASQIAGLAEVPCLVRDIPDEAALAMSLIENIQREDLNPLEEASGIQRLIDEFEMTHQQAADAVGRSRPAASNLLRLLNLAKPVQELLMAGDIDMGHARALLPLDGASQIQLANQVAARQLSVRDTERLVQQILNPRQKKPALQPGKYQPRTRMDPGSLEELAASIKAQGVMQPIMVRPVGEDSYEIIAGERRWRASQIAGLAEVPCLVREIPDEAALAMSLIENIQREDLNPLEEAGGIQRLIDEFDMTHQQAADAVGRSRPAASNLLRLLNLARPVQELLMAGDIDMGHARALLPLDGAGQIQLANQVAARQLSVRDTERLVQQILNPRQKKPAPQPDRDLLRLEEEVSDAIGATVKIKANKKGAGELTIRFGSLDQLEGVLGRLR